MRLVLEVEVADDECDEDVEGTYDAEPLPDVTFVEIVDMLLLGGSAGNRGDGACVVV